MQAYQALEGSLTRNDNVPGKVNYPELHFNNREVLGRGSGGSARNPKANKRSNRWRIERDGSTKQRANMFEKGLQGKRQLFLKPQQ